MLGNLPSSKTVIKREEVMDRYQLTIDIYTNQFEDGLFSMKLIHKN